jgi:hypothetical protein
VGLVPRAALQFFAGKPAPARTKKGVTREGHAFFSCAGC